MPSNLNQHLLPIQGGKNHQLHPERVVRKGPWTLASGSLTRRMTHPQHCRQ
ncbi:hypothetical protein CDAR_319961, partial [Caerostris darwini]